MGRAAFYRGDLRLAETEYQQAADISPGALAPLEGLASVKMTAGRFAEGVEAYARLVSHPGRFQGCACLRPCRCQALLAGWNAGRWPFSVSQGLRACRCLHHVHQPSTERLHPAAWQAPAAQTQPQLLHLCPTGQAGHFDAGWAWRPSRSAPQTRVRHCGRATRPQRTCTSSRSSPRP